jgi:hypothetical protein
MDARPPSPKWPTCLDTCLRFSILRSTCCSLSSAMQPRGSFSTPGSKRHAQSSMSRSKLTLQLRLARCVVLTAHRVVASNSLPAAFAHASLMHPTVSLPRALMHRSRLLALMHLISCSCWCSAAHTSDAQFTVSTMICGPRIHCAPCPHARSGPHALCTVQPAACPSAQVLEGLWVMLFA